MNHLYFGDSLDILKQLHSQHPQGFIDLVYIDPPFNSNRGYNVLFETVDLHDAKAQKEAFSDTWSNVSYKDELSELADLNLDLHKFLKTLDDLHISKPAVSYTTTMAIRIYYIHKVIKPTGSFYLHCDPTMSHYLKIVCDLIFGEKNFRNEITWQRTNAHSDAKNKFPDVNDSILFYAKSAKTPFTPTYTAHNEDYVKGFYRFDDKDGRGSYRLGDMGSPNPRPNMMYVWKGYSYPDKGWRYEKETMKKLDEEGRIYYPKNPDGSADFTKRLSLKRYLNEQKGNLISNNWNDIYPLQAADKERLGYPTQKPEALLERIIKASSKEGDLVADFFCGCGTTIAASQKLNRQWIGVDISHLAVGLIRKRLIDLYGESITKTFGIDGLPKDIGSAKNLAIQPLGRMHFQDWIIETMLGGVSNAKKTGDGGYDGYTTLEIEPGKKEIVVIEAKSGNIGVTNLRSFAKTVQQQKASAGILVCFKEQITKGMLSEAKGEGYLREDLFGNRFDKIQIICVEDLLAGKMPSLPNSNVTGPFKKAKKIIEGKKGKGLFD